MNTKVTDKREVSREGFVIADAIITKVGELPYTRKELNLDGDGVVMLDRPLEVLQDALHTMKGLPVTNGHPKDDVNPDNFKDHIVGAVVSEPNIDAEGNVRASVRLYDADAIDKAKRGENQLSPGFSFVPEYISDNKGLIKQAQFNHLAMVKHGRGGESVRLLDELPPPLNNIHITEMQVMDQDNKQLIEALTVAVKDAMSTPADKNTAPVDVEKRLVDAMAKTLEPMIKDITELKTQKANDEAKAETKKAEDALNEKIEEAVKAERAKFAIVQDAKPFIPEDKHDSLVNMEIKEVLKIAIGDSVEGLDDMDLATLNGVFMGVKATASKVKAEDASPTQSITIKKSASADETATLADIADMRFKAARGLEAK